LGQLSSWPLFFVRASGNPVPLNACMYEARVNCSADLDFAEELLLLGLI
jgi:hypothetical protein